MSVCGCVCVWRWHCGLLSISLETNPFVILVLQLQLCVIFVTLPSSIDQQRKAPLQPTHPAPSSLTHTRTHTHTRRLAHTESVHAFCCLIRRHYQDRMKLAMAAVAVAGTVAGAIISTPNPIATPPPLLLLVSLRLPVASRVAFCQLAWLVFNFRPWALRKSHIRNCFQVISHSSVSLSFSLHFISFPVIPFHSFRMTE